jgi:hypothetical protein
MIPFQVSKFRAPRPPGQNVYVEQDLQAKPRGRQTLAVKAFDDEAVGKPSDKIDCDIG